MADFTESDWKYLRGIHDEMLSALCGRIDQQAAEIVRHQAKSEHTKYLRLFKHVRASDDVIAQCFNDWRRSTVALRTLCLRRHKVLTQVQFEHLSPGARDLLNALESAVKGA